MIYVLNMVSFQFATFNNKIVFHILYSMGIVRCKEFPSNVIVERWFCKLQSPTHDNLKRTLSIGPRGTPFPDNPYDPYVEIS